MAIPAVQNTPANSPSFSEQDSSLNNNILSPKKKLALQPEESCFEKFNSHEKSRTDSCYTITTPSPSGISINSINPINRISRTTDTNYKSYTKYEGKLDSGERKEDISKTGEFEPTREKHRPSLKHLTDSKKTSAPHNDVDNSDFETATATATTANDMSTFYQLLDDQDIKESDKVTLYNGKFVAIHNLPLFHRLLRILPPLCFLFNWLNAANIRKHIISKTTNDKFLNKFNINKHLDQWRAKYLNGICKSDVREYINHFERHIEYSEKLSTHNRLETGFLIGLNPFKEELKPHKNFSNIASDYNKHITPLLNEVKINLSTCETNYNTYKNKNNSSIDGLDEIFKNIKDNIKYIKNIKEPKGEHKENSIPTQEVELYKIKLQTSYILLIQSQFSFGEIDKLIETNKNNRIHENLQLRSRHDISMAMHRFFDNIIGKMST